MNNNVGSVGIIIGVYNFKFHPVKISKWDRFKNWLKNWLFGKKNIPVGFGEYPLLVTPRFNAGVEERITGGALFKVSDIVIVEGLDPVFYVTDFPLMGSIDGRLNQRIKIKSVKAFPLNQFSKPINIGDELAIVGRAFSENTLTP